MFAGGFRACRAGMRAHPRWEQFSALPPLCPEFVPTHPPGCHRKRVSDRVVFDRVVLAWVHGSGHERIASPGCSDRTIRRRVRAWAEGGLAEHLHRLALERYDRLIGLDPADAVVDGCITEAPGGGEKAGRSPVDRGKQGPKRSTLTDATGIPLHLVSAGADRHDAPLPVPTLAGLDLLGPLPPTIALHLDRGYDGAVTRTLPSDLGLTGEIARKGIPAPIQAGKRWVVERTQSRMNGCGKLRRCTERAGVAIDFCLFLAAAPVIARSLIQRARETFRRDGRPTTRRLK